MDLPAQPSSRLRDRWQAPHPSRMSPNDPRGAEILDRHAAALDANLPTYVDPSSGFSVFTAAFLARRGYCCESGCRHCPFVT